MHMYQKTIADCMAELKTRLTGLTEQEVVVRREKYGKNQLTGKKKISPIALFFKQFLNPLVYLLVAAATVKAVVKGPLDAVTIIVVLLFMAIVGFIQEYRAGKAMDALLQLTAPKAKVKRDGNVNIVLAEELVPGDCIVLEAGDAVPADARVCEAVRLKVNESSLTGESLPVTKQCDAINTEASLGERTNMVYTGTSVVAGRAEAVVTDIGMSTEIGKIASAVHSQHEEKTSLQRSIDHLGHSLIWIVLSVCGVLAVLGLWQEMNLVDIFMLAVAAAVAAIPEGLPAVVTVVLATGMQRMARHSAIVRKLVAVETLGATTVICSDKTGTLTMNQMTVTELFVGGESIHVTGTGYEPKGAFSSSGAVLSGAMNDDVMVCLRIGLLCNNAALKADAKGYTIVGDPTEGALIVVAEKAGIVLDKEKQTYPRLAEVPFESERQFMVTLHGGKNKQLFIKGSLEKILPRASHVQIQGKQVVLDAALRERLMSQARRMAEKALRVLVFAYKEVPANTDVLEDASYEGNLVIAGLCGMMDPPREEAKHAISLCARGGIKVVMATGDNMVTGHAIAKALGIQGTRAVSGAELSQMTELELDACIEDVAVFARIEPLHKMRIIEGFKKRGHVVAMTGDGVNDAPALEAADIGVAMGITGTDVAKESADMVLADDNFATIVTAVEEGRAIFNRLRNVVFFLLVTCFGELMSLVLAILFTGQASLVPLQILWINLVTGALVAIPLGLEPCVGDELMYPPRNPKVGLIYKGMILRIFFISSMLSVGSFLVFLWTLHHYEIHEARAMAFTSIVVFEWLVAFNARSDEHTIFKIGLFKNPLLFVAILIGLFLQLLVLYVPYFARFFDTVPLRGFEWGVVFLPGGIIFVLETIRKAMAPKLFAHGKW